LKQAIAICAGVLAGSLALGLAGPQPATAQLVYPGYPVYPAYPGYAVIAPPEVTAIVQSNGMKPLTPPMRYGPAYMLRALDPNGQEVRVVVNARSGRIIAVRPTFGPRYAVVPPPYGRPPSGVPLAEDGYGPNPRVAGVRPDVDGPPGTGPAYGPGPGPAGAYPPGAGPAPGPGGAGPSYGPPPVGRAPAASPPGPSVQAGPPPLPRPRPKVASADSSAAAPTAAKPATAALPPAPSLPAAPELKDRVTTGTVAAPAAAPPPAAVEMHE
jgi:hypothetical protein